MSWILFMYGAGLIIGAVTGWFVSKEYYAIKRAKTEAAEKARQFERECEEYAKNYRRYRRVNGTFRLN